MRRPILVFALALVALAVVANVGFKLLGPLRQVDALGGAGTDSTASSAVRGPVIASALSAEAVAQTAATAEPLVPESEPTPPFDTEAAVREAGDQDPNVAELLNDPDPAVSGAVRDFITHLDPPGRDP